jgi:hypothetical protein
VSHPSLGLPPPSRTAGFPEDAQRIVATRDRLAARAFEAAVAADPTIRDRHDETAQRRLVRDTRTVLDVLARAVASNDPGEMAHWAEQVVPPYRRLGVPMDDLVTIANGVRAVVDSATTPEAFAAAGAALDAAIAVFRWHRRIAGDARRRNRLLSFIYKGA